MFVITATFEEELALARIRDVLAMADTPEAMAERLDLARDLETVRQAVVTPSLRRLMTEVKSRRQYLEITQQIETARSGKSPARFFGGGFSEKKVSRLNEERRKIPPLLDAMRWFYTLPRVVVLSSIRDFALDGSLHPDAAWREVPPSSLTFPIATMFEAGDLDFAKELTQELEKPLKQIDPKFLLTKFEGHRSIGFDLKTGVATYYVPAPSEGTAGA
jgi:hypothetical protein